MNQYNDFVPIEVIEQLESRSTRLITEKAKREGWGATITYGILIHKMNESAAYYGNERYLKRGLTEGEEVEWKKLEHDYKLLRHNARTGRWKE